MEDSEFLNQVISQFSKWYSPAATIADATDFYSTSEIVEALNQFNPGAKVNEEQIYQSMIDSGYQYAPAPGKLTFQLKWLIVRAS
ncbi:MAG: hypothetical protein JZU49_01000 [Sulfuricurvum sp.]|nr:hypothetical protein [Sulfuricurvum sp.]